MNANQRRPLLVLGPYAGATPGEVARNVARALAIGRLAVASGYAPVVPHAHGWLGLYGSALEEDANTRLAALACGRSIARALASQEAEAWVLLCDDGTPSAGTAGELDQWRSVPYAMQPVSRTWAEWRDRFVLVGLGEAWDAAEVVPLGPPA